MARPKAQRTVKAVPDETQEVETVQVAKLEATIELPEGETDVSIALPEPEMQTTPAPDIPTGYMAREIVWPAHFWRVFDKQAARGGLTTSKYLERLLQHMARE